MRRIAFAPLILLLSALVVGCAEEKITGQEASDACLERINLEPEVKSEISWTFGPEVVDENEEYRVDGAGFIEKKFGPGGYHLMQCHVDYDGTVNYSGFVPQDDIDSLKRRFG